MNRVRRDKWGLAPVVKKGDVRFFPSLSAIQSVGAAFAPLEKRSVPFFRQELMHRGSRDAAKPESDLSSEMRSDSMDPHGAGVRCASSVS